MKRFNLIVRYITNSIIIGLVVLLALLYIRYSYIHMKNQTENKALQIAKSIKEMLPKDDLKALEAMPSDLEKSQYQSIKQSLMDVIKVNPEARFAYIYTQRDNKIFFFADSEPEDSEDYSPPGQEYYEACK